MSDVYDNVAELYGGMNSNVLSSKPGERQYFKGVNITCRGGKIRTRPAFNILDLTFNNLTDKHVFEHGKFQGGDVYQTPNATYLICAVSGNVFAIEPETGRTANITAVTGRMDQLVDRLFFCQVEGYMVVQDGSNLAVIIDGPAARKAVPGNNEVPIGTIMAYGHGRLFVKVTPNSFMAGDINLPSTPGAVLRFTETAYLSGGGAFSLPGSLGEITAMTFVQHFETGSGQGPLVVFGKRGFETFDVFTPRSFWTDQDIGKVQLQGDGCSSASGVTVANEDLIFRTWHGLSSYLLTRELLPNRTLVDMSAEMMAYEEQETSWMRPFSSMVFFDNRILFTVVGEKIDAETLEGEAVDDYRFKAIGSLDVQPLTGITQNQVYPNGVYDGIWTGINPTALVAGNFDDVERCFVFGKTNDGINTVHEIGNSSGHDCDMNPIQCRLYLRALSFFDFSKGIPSSAIYNNKTVNRAHIYLDGVEDDVDFILYGKPDHRSQFTRLSTMSVRAPTVYSPPPHTIVESGIAQGRAKYAFPDLIPRQGDPIFDLDVLTGYEFEFCVEWAGLVCLTRLGFEAVTIDEIARIGDETEGKLLPPADLDDFGYQSGCRHLLDLVISSPPLYWYLAVDGTWTPEVDVWFFPDDGGDAVPVGAHEGFSNGPGIITIRGGGGGGGGGGEGWQPPGPGFPPQPPWTPPNPRWWPPPPPNPPVPPVNPIKGKPPIVPIPPPDPLDPEPPGGGNDDPHLVLEVQAPAQVGVGQTFQVGLIMWLYWNGLCARYMGALPSIINLALNPANGVTINGGVKTVTWVNGGAVITGLVCTGGVMPVTDIGMEVTVGCGGLPIVGVDMMQVKAGPPLMAANTPVALWTTTAGIHGIWEDITLTNASMGSFLKWTAAIIADTSGQLALSKAAYSGLGLQGSETIVLSLTVMPAAGVYAATVRFTDSEGVLPNVDVTVNLTVVEVYVGTVPVRTVGRGLGWGYDPPPGTPINELRNMTYHGPNNWYSDTTHLEVYQLQYLVASPAWGVYGVWSGVGWYVRWGWDATYWHDPAYPDPNIWYKVAVTFDPATGCPMGTAGSNRQHVDYGSGGGFVSVEENTSTFGPGV
jgi:hypothetical protein